MIAEEITWLRDVPPEEMRRIVDALYRVHGLIAVITDLDTLLERIMTESKEVASAEACSLMLYDHRMQELYFQVALGEEGDQQALKREIRLKLNQGIAGAAAATRQSINVPDVRRDERFFMGADETSHFVTKSLLAVPLLDRETLIGVVEVVNKVGGGEFTETDCHVMEMFASLAASAISNARLIEENLRAERMAAIGEAMSGLSHFIKNIITAMTGSTDLIDQALERGQTDLLKTSWPVLVRCTRRISNFVQDMLAFSKPRRPVYELCEIDVLADEVARMFKSLLVHKQIDLEVDCSGVDRPCLIDQDGIYRCLLNVFMNAGDALPLSGGLIRMGARLEDRDLFLEVADNGPGVPADIAAKIFEPFFSTKGTQGTGLGLAVTHKIVTEHGGAISVETSPEGGALFRIVLKGVGTKGSLRQ